MISDVVFGIIVVAMILVLVRPGSRATTAVRNFGSSYAELISAAVAA